MAITTAESKPYSLHNADAEMAALLDMDFTQAQEHIGVDSDDTTIVRTFISRRVNCAHPLRTVLAILSSYILRGVVCEGIARAYDDVIVVAVLDSRMGLRLMEKQHFNAIVCDVRMPYISGEALIERVKKTSPQSHMIALVDGQAEYTRIAGTHCADSLFRKGEPAKELIALVGAGFLESQPYTSRIAEEDLLCAHTRRLATLRSSKTGA